jgi:hypothetical protein
MTRRLAVLAAVAVVAALAAPTPASLAFLTSNRTSPAAFTSGSLQPPTGVGGTAGSSVSLDWTASSSSNATGYHLLRSSTSGSGYAQVKNVTPVSATAATDAPGFGTWYYVLDTYLGGWTSAHSNEAEVMLSSQVSTPTVGCDPTKQAPETSSAGNNDGYESNPGDACAAGGGYAIDDRSGTDSVNDCSDPGKDRHRFWGYGFGLPGSVTSIDGITVTAIAGQSNNGGIASLCLQLSWDGGTTWSSPAQVLLSGTALATYTVGSSTDTWGHAWTPAQLTGTAFRIRVTDVATTPNKSFYLDSLGVTVTYTP